MNEEQERLREQFQRDVEIVRGAGGFAPTTDDLRAHGEQMFWAAVSESSMGPTYDEAEILTMRIEDSLMHLSYNFAHRHDPEWRAHARREIKSIREDRAALAKLKQ